MFFVSVERIRLAVSVSRQFFLFYHTRTQFLPIDFHTLLILLIFQKVLAYLWFLLQMTANWIWPGVYLPLTLTQLIVVKTVLAKIDLSVNGLTTMWKQTMIIWNWILPCIKTCRVNVVSWVFCNVKTRLNLGQI